MAAGLMAIMLGGAGAGVAYAADCPGASAAGHRVAVSVHDDGRHPEVLDGRHPGSSPDRHRDSVDGRHFEPAERTRHALAVRVPGDAPLQWRLPRFIDLTWLAQVFENLRATGHTAAMAVRIPAPARSLRSDTAEERQAPPSQDPRPSDAPLPEEQAVVDLVNKERAAAGCQPLTVDDRLARAARKHSADMVARGYFDHTTPEGASFVDRARAEGYPNPSAENIAKGHRSAQSVVRGWMASDRHRANILNCDLRTIGVGLSKDGWVWTQVFGY